MEEKQPAYFVDIYIFQTLANRMINNYPPAWGSVRGADPLMEEDLNIWKM
jgi:hypothetical protein